MVIFRLIALLLVLGFVLSLAAHTLTGEAIWRHRAMQILKWGVVLGLCVMGLFVLQRAAVFL